MYIVYSKPGCTYCDQAKTLLNSKNIAFEEKILDVGQTKEAGITYVTVQQLRDVVPQARTVPQILKDGVLIGGFDALKQSLE